MAQSGLTRDGLNHETDIWKDERGDAFRNVWYQVKDACLYFYDLIPLLGERMEVTDHTVNKSVDPTVSSICWLEKPVH